MTELSLKWKEIFNEISLADEHVVGKVNYYNLSSILEDLYVINSELEEKVEALELFVPTGLIEDMHNAMSKIDTSKVLIEGDTVTVMGVKYKRIEETQPFYDKLWGLLKTKLGDSVDCDEMADRVRDLIREHIPEPMIDEDYDAGYNECIRKIKSKLQL